MLRIAAEWNSVWVRIPSGAKSMKTDFVYRTFPGWRLARAFEMISGSIGSTRSGR